MTRLQIINIDGALHMYCTVQGLPFPCHCNSKESSKSTSEFILFITSKYVGFLPVSIDWKIIILVVDLNQGQNRVSVCSSKRFFYKQIEISVSINHGCKI